MKFIEERHNEDLLKKVYLAQKENKTRGDFVELVAKDLESFNILCNEITSNLLIERRH